MKKILVVLCFYGCLKAEDSNPVKPPAPPKGMFVKHKKPKIDFYSVKSRDVVGEIDYPQRDGSIVRVYLITPMPCPPAPNTWTYQKDPSKNYIQLGPITPPVYARPWCCIK